MIYKNFIIVLALFVALPCCALQKGAVDYDGLGVDFSILNYSEILLKADSHLAEYEKSGDKNKLTTAMGEYYVLTKIRPSEFYPNIQLARVYDSCKLDKLAKSYFSKSLSIDKNNPAANYYFGDFYYKRADYKHALRFFKRAFQRGYENSYDINYKIATIYEKFADLKSAKYYYSRAYSLKSSESKLREKITEIDSLHYDKSEYYERNN